MDKMNIFGCEPYNSISEKNYLIKKLKKEFKEKLRIWVENGILYYESFGYRDNY
jgi:hypothetical protein